MQNVSDRPPSRFQKLPNFFFFFPGRISCVWRGDPVRSLWLFGAEAGFPPLAFPPSEQRSKKIPRAIKGTPWISLRWDCPNKKTPHKRHYLLISANSSGLGSASFRWHACVQQTQHCALWLWCVLFRPPLVASLSFPPRLSDILCWSWGAK